MNELSNFWLKIRLPIFLILFFSIGGTIGYKFLFPHIDWSDLFFMTIISLSTVGYEDFLGVRDFLAAKIYTGFLIMLGMIIIAYCTSRLGIILLEGDFIKFFGMRYIRSKFQNIKGHYIICGCGTTGIHIVEEMIKLNKNFIIIESDALKISGLMEKNKNLSIIEGDATSDDILEKANIHTAKGIFFVLSNDKDNLFGTVTANLLNSNIRIIARAIDDTIQKKLIKAGAVEIVCPNIIGGYRMVAEMFRPKTVDFWEQLNQSATSRLESSIIKKGSKMIGSTIKEINFLNNLQTTIIGYAKHFEDKNYIYNLDGNEILEEDSIIFYIADSNKKKEIDKLCI